LALGLGVVGGRGMPVGAVMAAGAVPARGAANTGYRLLGGDGGVFSFGSTFEGSAAPDPSACPANTSDRSMPDGTCWAMATTPSDKGYWILNAYTGVVRTFGDAVFYGDPSALDVGMADLWPVARAIVSTPDGKGYWILEYGLSGLGSVRAFGDAHAYGDQLSIPGAGDLNGEPVGMASTPDGGGYWIVDSDGGVFAFGDAVFAGSMGGHALTARVVAITRTNSGAGYWLVASDGGVFAFGDAVFAGSMGAAHLAAPVVAMASAPGGGYWLAGSDGGVFTFGAAAFLGSMGGDWMHRPIFAISASTGVLG